MIHPLWCYVGIALTFSVSLSLFVKDVLDYTRYFYVPVLMLIGFYTLHAVLTDKQKYQKRTLRQAAPKALGKYIFWGLVLYGVIRFYEAHPLYHQGAMVSTLPFLKDFFRLFLWLGLPYFFLEEKYRYCLDNVMADPYIKLLLLLRWIRRKKFRLLGRRLVSRPYKRILLAALIRIHYIPIMIFQVYFGVVNLTVLLQRPDLKLDLLSFLALGTGLVWLIDSNNGSISYFWQSSFTKTRFREIDPHPAHWIVVLICYWPFIELAAMFLSTTSLPENSPRFFNSVAVNTGIEVAMLVTLVLYMLSGSALAFSTSNLCYKKIQTRGPYRFMRHPATTFKLIFFFLAYFRFAAAYRILGLLCYLAWFSVYIGRALVEERFLRRFADYRAYMKQTRYRFLPGLV